MNHEHAINISDDDGTNQQDQYPSQSKEMQQGPRTLDKTPSSATVHVNYIEATLELIYDKLDKVQIELEKVNDAAHVNILPDEIDAEKAFETTDQVRLAAKMDMKTTSKEYANCDCEGARKSRDAVDKYIKSFSQAGEERDVPRYGLLVRDVLAKARGESAAAAAGEQSRQHEDASKNIHFEERNKSNRVKDQGSGSRSTPDVNRDRSDNADLHLNDSCQHDSHHHHENNTSRSARLNSIREFHHIKNLNVAIQRLNALLPNDWYQNSKLGAEPKDEQDLRIVNDAAMYIRMLELTG